MAKKRIIQGSETLANARVTSAAEKKKIRAQRPFPACSFEEALGFAKSILDYGSGQAVRRLSLFDHLKKSPESGPSRQLITNAGKYGLIEGSYAAEQLKLTADGLRAVDDEIGKREQTKARIKLAIDDIDPFKSLFDRFAGNKLPARKALTDAIQEFSVPTSLAEEAIDTFIINLRFVGLLATLSGAERVVTVDHLLDSLPATAIKSADGALQAKDVPKPGSLITAEHAQFESTCFYVTPIGEDGTEQRKHSDLFLGSIVEPALEQFSPEGDTRRRDRQARDYNTTNY